MRGHHVGHYTISDWLMARLVNPNTKYRWGVAAMEPTAVWGVDTFSENSKCNFVQKFWSNRPKFPRALHGCLVQALKRCIFHGMEVSLLHNSNLPTPSRKTPSLQLRLQFYDVRFYGPSVCLSYEGCSPTASNCPGWRIPPARIGQVSRRP